MIRSSVILFAVLLLIFSCKSPVENGKDLPVARVYDKYLYTSDLVGIIPENISSTDSLAMTRDFIDKWVKKQLILKKAENNLTDDEKNVEKQINDYRTSLLIFKYEQNITHQKLDTLITDEEIKNYYKENTSNFILNHNLVKAMYIKVPRTAPDIWKLRQWYKSDEDKDIKDLEAYCYKHAEKYEYFNDDWINFTLLQNELPRLYSSTENTLKYKKSLEVRDSLNYYFVKINDYKLEGTTAPLDYVSNNIKSILLNKRKITFIQKLENDIYNNAIDHGNFNIY